MTIADYLEVVKSRLVTDPSILEFQILRERMTLVDAHLRVRLVLVDSSVLEFSEYVQRFATDEIRVITYSYHWADVHGGLIRRWDNTPHFPNLPGFPHHIHDGVRGTVNPGALIDIFQVLDQINQLLPSSYP